jgi:hypothetical protein
MSATILVLLVGKWTRVITFPGLSRDTWRKIWPLPVLYLGKQQEQVTIPPGLPDFSWYNIPKHVKMYQNGGKYTYQMSGKLTKRT